MVPPAATAIEMSVIPDPDLNRQPPQSAAVTSPAAVRRITAMVNALPVFPPGQRECGLGRGEVEALVLTFLSAPRGGSSRPLTSARKAASRLCSPWALRRSLATRGPGMPPGSRNSASRIAVARSPAPS